MITKYLITIKRENELSNKFILDCFFPIKLPWDPDDKNCTVTKIADQFAPSLGKALQTTLHKLQLRLLFNPHHIGPLIVNWTSAYALEAAKLNDYIGALNLEEVQAFVKESKL